MKLSSDASARLFNMHADHSQSTFRESARQALAATKKHDGTLRFHQPLHDHNQVKKVANLKEKLS